MARYQNDYQKATSLQKEILAYSQEIASKGGIAYSLHQLGGLARLQNNYAAARSLLIEALILAKEIDGRELVAYCLEEFAALNADQGKVERAAGLFGAAEALREAIHAVLLPVEKMEVDKNISAVRAQFDKDAFNAAWAAGRAMSMEQAIKYGLNDLTG